MAESTENTPAAANADADKDKPTPAAAPVVDVQERINQELAKQQEQFNAQFKEATGHDDLKAFTEAQLQQQGKLKELADARGAEAADFKGKYHQERISNVLLTAAGEAIDPATVKDLLAGRAQVDGNGNVTIDGKSVVDAVKKLLEDRPFLAKAQGGTGSGAPQNAGGGKQVSRAEFERMNPTDQSAHIKSGGIVV